MKNDLYFMGKALEEAVKAFRKGEVPVGAVLTLNDEIVSIGHNTCLLYTSPSPRDRQKSRMPSSA